MSCIDYVLYWLLYSLFFGLPANSFQKVHITPIHPQLHGLLVLCSTKFKILLFTFKALHDLTTLYLSELLTPDARSRSLRSSCFINSLSHAPDFPPRETGLSVPWPPNSGILFLNRSVTTVLSLLFQIWFKDFSFSWTFLYLYDLVGFFPPFSMWSDLGTLWKALYNCNFKKWFIIINIIIIIDTPMWWYLLKDMHLLPSNLIIFL